MLHLLNITDDSIVKQVFEMRQSVEDPESGIIAVGQHVAITNAVFNGNLTDGAVEWRINGRVGIVNAKPDDASNGVGQP